MIAVTASHIRKIHLALVYANKSLEYYRSIYNLKRAAECHIIIGISLRRINEYKKSLESYQLASTIAKSIHNNRIYSLSIQNMGKLYSVMNDSKQAIEYYLKSYELRADSPQRNKSFQYQV
ncbi:tetratricopeptide repeat protein [Oceanobacillus sp. 143]|nr:tetratricopeptide repeat protein [Oceanobacillus sp. 143]